MYTILLRGAIPACIGQEDRKANTQTKQTHAHLQEIQNIHFHRDNLQILPFGSSLNTSYLCNNAAVLIRASALPMSKSLIYLFTVCTLLACFLTFFPFVLIVKAKKARAAGDSKRWENNKEIMPEIYLRHEPAFKSYSEACNRDWFWSADLPHPVWKKYWQSILHCLKIIATVPLPCSNLPLDHSRQGHRVHYRDWREAGDGEDTGTSEQGTRSFFKRGWGVRGNFQN